MFIFMGCIYIIISYWINISCILYLTFCKSYVKQKENISYECTYT